jgi:release factor glutamine methyltransferase
MTWRELIEWAAKELDRAGVEDPAANAEYLALHTLGLWRRGDLRSRRDQPGDESAYKALVSRRAAREPLQYIIGEWEFCGLRLSCSPAALIPRPETEGLVMEALKEIRVARPGVLDIGTGTGAIALAMASNLRDAKVLGIDVSADAVTLATKNRSTLGLDNVAMLQADVFSDEAVGRLGRFDIVLSNPPYVSAHDYGEIEPELLHEPRIAITDEAQGLRFYERIIDIAPNVLEPSGRLILELGYDLGDSVSALVTKGGLEVLRIVKDFQGIDRVLVACSM